MSQHGVQSLENLAKTEQVQDKRRHDSSIKVFIVDNPYLKIIFSEQQTYGYGSGS